MYRDGVTDPTVVLIWDTAAKTTDRIDPGSKSAYHHKVRQERACGGREANLWEHRAEMAATLGFPGWLPLVLLFQMACKWELVSQPTVKIGTASHQ